MLTFREFIIEADGMTTTALTGLVAKVSGLTRQIHQTPTATKADKILSTQILWLASLMALSVVAGKTNR